MKRNVTQMVEDNKLIITVDLGHTLGPSKTGKSILIAQAGNLNVENDAKEICRVSLTVYKSKNSAEVTT